jgi:hypothetical protein
VASHALLEGYGSRMVPGSEIRPRYPPFPEKAILEVTLPEGLPLGPLGLWVATSAGPSEPFLLIVDVADGATGNLTNSVTVSGDQEDVVPVNNTATAIVALPVTRLAADFLPARRTLAALRHE